MQVGGSVGGCGWAGRRVRVRALEGGRHRVGCPPGRLDAGELLREELIALREFSVRAGRCIPLLVCYFTFVAKTRHLHHEGITSMHHDEKYIAFKRAEFDAIDPKEAWQLIGREHRTVKPLEDAVVIRTQDIFAAAGLEAYANNIRVYVGAIVGLIPDLPPERRGPAQAMVDRLLAVTTYFMDCAAEAEDRMARGDVKVPD